MKENKSTPIFTKKLKTLIIYILYTVFTGGAAFITNNRFLGTIIVFILIISTIGGFFYHYLWSINVFFTIIDILSIPLLIKKIKNIS